MRVRISLILLTVLLLPGLTSCARRVTAFDFQTPDGQVRLTEEPGVSREQEGVLNQARPAAAYQLRRAYQVAEDSTRSAFHLTYSGNFHNARLTLSGPDGEEIASSTLPGGESEKGTRILLVPLPAGALISGFRVALDHPGSETTLHISGAGAGAGAFIPGVHTSGGSTTFSDGWDLQKNRLSPENVTVTLPRESGEEGGAQRLGVRLEYRYDAAGREGTEPPPDGLPEVEISLRGRSFRAASGSLRRELLLRLRPGNHPVYLYDSATGVIPDQIQVHANLPGVSVIAAEPVALPPFPQPIPADLGTILDQYPRSAWRSSDYELFSWNLFPQILVFDTRSYAVQSRMFKRLAFFVEKRGFRGTLLPNSTLDRHHGWNAHNYRPTDLARFFNQADNMGITLNTEEVQLRDVLAANGVLLRDSDGSVFPGEGGIISISQESYPVLRKLLLTHEAFHGAYYALPGYRETVDRTWNQLSEAERNYWRFFFRYMTYDPEDPYLMKNEFQAYLVQQPADRVPGYFRSVAAGRLRAAYPQRIDYINEFLTTHPSIFEDSARILGNELWKESGLVAGDVFDLRPSEQ